MSLFPSPTKIEGLKDTPFTCSLLRIVPSPGLCFDIGCQVLCEDMRVQATVPSHNTLEGAYSRAAVMAVNACHGGCWTTGQSLRQ